MPRRTRRTIRPRRSVSRYARFFELSADVQVVLDRDGVFRMVNPAVREILGYAPGDLVGRHLEEFLVPEDAEATRDAVLRLSRPGTERRITNRYRHRDGHPVWIEWTAVGHPGGHIYGSGRDITEDRRRQEELRAREALQRAMFDHAAVGICLADLDGTMVEVNPELCRFLGRAREDLVGVRLERFIADEDRDAGREAYQRVLRGTVDSYRAERRYRHADGGVVWGLAGVSRVTTPGGDARMLVQLMDITSRKAVEDGVRAELEDVVCAGILQRALDEDRLLLFSQPIVELATGATLREELLVRLVDDDGDLVRPDGFLPVAERFGMIGDVDLWVAGQAIACARAGRAVNVNVSARSLDDRRIGELVGRELAREPFDPGLLTFEITETALASDMGIVAEFARTLARLGCPLAIDDFGVGYGGLKYVRALEGVACLKIDRSFVQGVADNRPDREIVRAVTGLARRLGQYVVAEGIEDDATVAWLVQEGIRYGQGYALERPELLATAPPATSDSL